MRVKITLHILILPALLIVLTGRILASGNYDSTIFFKNAFKEVREMLEGKQPLDFERAVFVTENAYMENEISYEGFQKALEANTFLINKLIAANNRENSLNFKVLIDFNAPKFDVSNLRYTEKEKREFYRNALANWAIFTYMTDTVSFSGVQHLPFTYQFNDPFGMTDWKNSQVINLFGTKSGNCFALVSLFKIFSDRLNSNAYICTAPQHIYIQHRDHKGDFFNVELATHSFPGDGSLQTLTYTYQEGIVNGISLRRLDDKQAISLCLVNLGKSYEHKFKTKDDDFILQCAELALKYDSLSLNAMLLKEQVLEERVIKYANQKNITEINNIKTDKKIGTTYQELETQVIKLYDLGYRQMPLYMQEMIMSALKREDNKPVMIHDRTPNPFTSIAVLPDDRRYSTLSGGVFEEVHDKKQFEQYGRFTIDTEKRKIIKMESENNFEFLIDPVVFAWSVDPLAEERVEWSPYNAFRDNPILNVDPTGALDTEFKDKDGKTISKVDDGSNAVFQQTGTGTNLHYEFTGYSNQGGKDEITSKVFTSVIQEQQNLNMKNPSLQQDYNASTQKYGGTHCNQATHDIQLATQSAYQAQGNKSINLLTPGRANDVAQDLADKKYDAYKSVTQSEAEKAAKEGKLVIVAYKNPSGSGHLTTFSVGSNISKGTLANIGVKSSTGFVPLKGAKNAAYRAEHDVKFYIIK